MSNEEIKKEFEVEDKRPAWEILNEQKEKLLEIIKEKPEILDTQLLKPEIIYPNMERYEMSNGMNNLMLSIVSADKKYADNTWVMTETVKNAKLNKNTFEAKLEKFFIEQKYTIKNKKEIKEIDKEELKSNIENTKNFEGKLHKDSFRMEYFPNKAMGTAKKTIEESKIEKNIEKNKKKTKEKEKER